MTTYLICAALCLAILLVANLFDPPDDRLQFHWNLLFALFWPLLVAGVLIVAVMEVWERMEE